MVRFKNIPTQKKSPYHSLKNKWVKRHSLIKEQLLTTHRDSLDWLVSNLPAKHHLAAGSLSGLLLLAPQISSPLPVASTPAKEQVLEVPKKVFLITELSSILPQEVGPLDPGVEKKIAGVLSDELGFGVSAEMQNKRLNTSYGYIGAEQHLTRYPGDTMSTHFQTNNEQLRFEKSGMAPGRGAWGYFAYSQAEMTQRDIDREKYYIAVQTFMSDGYSQRVREYVEFFKFRKMLVVNPQNGKAMIVVIGDAGPAVWTGKHLGGSPEVMGYLERFDGRQRGPVLYFFIDDPEDKIPLGPIEL